jgi:hypothetical protein
VCVGLAILILGITLITVMVMQAAENKVKA